MRSLLLYLVLVAPVWNGVAQDPTFTASVDRNPVPLGEQFTLTIVLSNAGIGGGKNLKLPDLSSFHIMSGPNQSSSMQFINGVVTSSVSYSYVLQPKERGKFVIGSGSIEVGGTVYRTDPVTVEVVKVSPQKSPQQTETSDLTSQIGDNLFLKAIVDRSRVMQGEQINLTFKLYTRVSIASYEIGKLPSMIGFWSEEIDNPTNPPLVTETVNGKQYRVATLRRLALFPTQSGVLEINPMELKTTLQVQSRSVDPFDAFFRDPFGQTVNYIVKSERLKVHVDPLPPGAPTGFKGAIGKFTLKASVDKKNTTTNDPVTLTVSISGAGNVKLLEAPEVEFPVDFEKYTPKVSENIVRDKEKISGSKTFEYLLIPRLPGKKLIKPIRFVYFDLGLEQYKVLHTPEVEIHVEQGMTVLSPGIGGGTRADVQLLTQDIRFIKVGNSSLSRRGEYLHTGWVFLVLVLFPLAGVIGAVFFGRGREKVDVVGLRNKQAIRRAQQGLRVASKLLKSSMDREQKLEFYAELSRGLQRYLCGKLGIQQADMSIDMVLAELSRRSIDGETVATLRTLLESCEMARFAPTSMEFSAMQKVFDEARKTIVTLERLLKAS